MKILIGTNNLNKFKNYKDAFKVYAPDIELLSPADLQITDDPEEDCDTLRENAIKKAKFFGEKSNIITMSDDTGLFVDALNGEPGLHTKRWHQGSDHDRCVKLLERLQGKKRSAQYKWAVAAYNPLNKKVWTFECDLGGEISDDFRETGGFGYDKMFNVVSLNKHYSELSPKELLEIGGRGRGVKELVLNTEFLEQL
jgi:XTP/dITP diphosphohydrolase